MAVVDLACQELVELVTDYFENALSATDRARFEAHLGNCPGCTAYLEQMKQTIWITGQLTPEDVPPEAEADLLEIFHNWKKD